MGITLADLHMIAKKLKKLAEPCKQVETDLQAQYMTLEDPFGHRWHVGDKYYVVPALPHKTRIQY